MGSINVKNLGKAYKQYHTRWLRLLEWLTPQSRQYHQLKWVLQDINFTVQPGEAVGIIGINGAGKSTLLKLITGTTQPTTGSVTMTGRVAAMLELGMGFHPDFTGRQNAIMAAQLLGLSGKEIHRLMPEIEAFAEIGDYIDLPVRVYSSGMQMRLAFSVATVVRPDVLIVDEALSVGDAYFQHKSFNRIREFQEKGTTLLMVSHDKEAIQLTCDRAILIDSGHCVMDGVPKDVVDYYNALYSKQGAIERIVLDDGNVQTVSGGHDVEIESFHIVADDGDVLTQVSVGESVSFRITILVKKLIPELVLGFLIKDRLGQTVYGTNTHHYKKTIRNVGNQKIVFVFNFNMILGPGSYSISLAAHDADTHFGQNYIWKDYAGMFNVVNLTKPYFNGFVNLDPKLEVYLD